MVDSAAAQTDVAGAHSYRAVRSTVVNEGVLITVMRGQVTLASVRDSFSEFRNCLAQANSGVWLMDLSGVTSFQPQTVGAGAAWFKHFRERGGTTLLFVSTLPSARMVAATLSFSSGLQVEVFDSLQGAAIRSGTPLHEVQMAIRPSVPRRD